MILETNNTEKRPRSGLSWTEADVAKLAELYPKTSNKDLAVRLGRPIWGIIGKARGLALKKDYVGGYQRQYPAEIIPWSDKEETLLTEIFPTTTNEEIAEKMDRSLDAIASKARKLGLRKMEFWSEDEDGLLKKLYTKMSYEQLAQRMGRTRSAVQIRVITLKLDCKVDNWTEEEINFLNKNYLLMTYQQIGQKIGRTWTAVAAKAEKIGIFKNCRWTGQASRI